MQVANVCQEKRVYIRLSSDGGWLSVEEWPAHYQFSQAHLEDIYNFDIDLPHIRKPPAGNGINEQVRFIKNHC
jgi:hypothetical protein